MTFIKKLFFISSMMIVILLSYADVPDPLQNSSVNNLAYDSVSKFYLGGLLGASFFSNKTFRIGNNSADLSANQFVWGGFLGYKFNEYIALETAFQKLGKLFLNHSFTTFLNSYSANLYNGSIDLLLSYPVLNEYSYTASLYAKGGYGLNDTPYEYTAFNNALSRSDTLVKGAYNAGLGFNVDFRSNLSTRLEYSLYQVHYPLLDNNTSHHAQVLSVGLYYNFST